MLTGGLFLISNGTHLYLFEIGHELFSVALGVLSRRDSFLKEFDYFPAMGFLTKGLPRDAKVHFSLPFA